MQPTWREGESVVKIVPADVDWMSLMRGGSNGLSLVVMALSWWVYSMKAPDSGLLEAIGDVQWVFSQLVATLSSTRTEVGNKRPCATSPKDEPNSKR